MSQRMCRRRGKRAAERWAENLHKYIRSSARPSSSIIYDFITSLLSLFISIRWGSSDSVSFSFSFSFRFFIPLSFTKGNEIAATFRHFLLRLHTARLAVNPFSSVDAKHLYFVSNDRHDADIFIIHSFIDNLLVWSLRLFFFRSRLLDRKRQQWK